MKGDLKQLQHLLGGTLCGNSAEFDGVSIDSRTLPAGALFVALRGPRFDGHHYLPQAAARGATAALVAADHPGAGESASAIPQLQLPDTLAALSQLAAHHRRHSNPRLVAITGSNGKTTVKELTAAILRQVAPTLATEGNLNNHIGVPLTLLRLRHHPYAVIEMGANHSGEIAHLSSLAAPDVAILNNAGRAHLEGFGSIAGVARAKGEIVTGLAPNGSLIYNADDLWGDYWYHLPGSYRRIGFTMKHGDRSSARPAVDRSSARPAVDHPSARPAVDRSSARPATNPPILLYGESLDHNRLRIQSPDWQLEIALQLTGQHNHANALAAAAAAWALAIDPQAIRQGLEQVASVRGRLQPRPGRNGASLIDDSYNANPDSVLAAIHHLAQQPGERCLILGELAELGSAAEQHYRELGEAAKTAGIEQLWLIGPATAAAPTYGPRARCFSDSNALLAHALPRLHSEQLILIKGSRRAGLEQVVAGLAAECLLK